MIPEFYATHFKNKIAIVDLKNIQAEINSLVQNYDKDFLSFVCFEMYSDGKITRFNKGIKDWSFEQKVMKKLIIGIFDEDDYYNQYPSIRNLKREEDIIFIKTESIKIKKYGSGIIYRTPKEILRKYGADKNEYKLTNEFLEYLEAYDATAYRTIMKYILREYKKGNLNE